MKMSIKPFIIDLRPAPKGGQYGYSTDWQLLTPWICISAFGITFHHKGDTVCWMFKRHQGRRWYSYGFGDAFSSLKAIDDMWDEYLAVYNMWDDYFTTCRKEE